MAVLIARPLAAEQVLRAMIEQTEDEPVEAQTRSSLAQFLATKAQRVHMIDAMSGRGEKVALEYGVRSLKRFRSDRYVNRVRRFDRMLRLSFFDHHKMSSWILLG